MFAMRRQEPLVPGAHAQKVISPPGSWMALTPAAVIDELEARVSLLEKALLPPKPKRAMPLSPSVRQERRWGSVTDLTPSGILEPEASSSSSSDDEEGGDGLNSDAGGGNEISMLLRELIKVDAPGSQTHSPSGSPRTHLFSSHHHHHYHRRTRTKIICAVGPACQTKEQLGELLDAGMSVARLNFSHGDHAYHLRSLNNLRAAVAERRAKGINCHCAVLMDTKGPEIRTGKLVNGSVTLKAGQILLFSSADYDQKLGDDTCITCSYENLAEDVKEGGRILVADGELTLTIIDRRPLDKAVVVKVENDFVLGERKNVNLPGIQLRLPGITDKDRYDIAEFALKHDIDIISGSFVRTGENVRALKACLGGAQIRVHAKIESVEALKNLDDIIREADGVHVSRGDLGMELDLSKLAMAQKAIIHAANVAGKPVVTSTQTLQSMVVKPRPTNAECTDVANAVLDGTDCVMLSAETANGAYPRLAVSTMSKIITQAERLVNFEAEYYNTRLETLQLQGAVPVVEAICSTAVETAIELKAQVIVVASDSGRMGVLVAKYRPVARILVVTESERVANQMCVSRGVEAIVVPSIRNLDVVWEQALRLCFSVPHSPWFLPPGSKVVLVDSPPASYNTINELLKAETGGIGRWNMCRVMVVPEMSVELAPLTL